MEILSLLNSQLNTVLFKSFSQIETNWWQALVLDKVTFQQKYYKAIVLKENIKRMRFMSLKAKLWRKIFYNKGSAFIKQSW